MITSQNIREECEANYRVYERYEPWVGLRRDVGWWKRCDWQAHTKPNAKLKALFDQLVEAWRDETWHMSSARKRISHPAYLKIIGLGEPAIPLILHEIEATPDYWFPALEAISREDPAPANANMRALREAWLQWGRDHDYID